MNVDLSDSFSLSLSREKEDAVSRVSHLNLSLLLEGISSRKLLCLFPGLSCLPKECAYGPIFLFLFCRYSHSPSISLFTAPDWSSSHLQHLYLSDILLFSFLSDDSKSSLFLSLSLRTCLWFCPPPSHSVSSLCLRMYLRPMCFPFVVSWFPYIQSPFVTHDTWFCGVKILHFSSWSRVMLQRKESWRETSCALSLHQPDNVSHTSVKDWLHKRERVCNWRDRERGSLWQSWFKECITAISGFVVDSYHFSSMTGKTWRWLEGKSQTEVAMKMDDNVTLISAHMTNRIETRDERVTWNW